MLRPTLVVALAVTAASASNLPDGDGAGDGAGDAATGPGAAVAGKGAGKGRSYPKGGEEGSAPPPVAMEELAAAILADTGGPGSPDMSDSTSGMLRGGKGGPGRGKGGISDILAAIRCKQNFLADLFEGKGGASSSRTGPHILPTPAEIALALGVDQGDGESDEGSRRTFSNDARGWQQLFSPGARTASEWQEVSGRFHTSCAGLQRGLLSSATGVDPRTGTPLVEHLRETHELIHKDLVGGNPAGGCSISDTLAAFRCKAKGGMDDAEVWREMGNVDPKALGKFVSNMGGGIGAAVAKGGASAEVLEKLEAKVDSLVLSMGRGGNEEERGGTTEAEADAAAEFTLGLEEIREEMRTTEGVEQLANYCGATAFSREQMLGEDADMMREFDLNLFQQIGCNKKIFCDVRFEEERASASGSGSSTDAAEQSVTTLLLARTLPIQLDCPPRAASAAAGGNGISAAELKQTLLAKLGATYPELHGKIAPLKPPQVRLMLAQTAAGGGPQKYQLVREQATFVPDDTAPAVLQLSVTLNYQDENLAPKNVLVFDRLQVKLRQATRMGILQLLAAWKSRGSREEDDDSAAGLRQQVPEHMKFLSPREERAEPEAGASAPSSVAQTVTKNGVADLLASAVWGKWLRAFSVAVGSLAMYRFEGRQLQEAAEKGITGVMLPVDLDSVLAKQVDKELHEALAIDVKSGNADERQEEEGEARPEPPSSTASAADAALTERAPAAEEQQESLPSTKTKNSYFANNNMKPLWRRPEPDGVDLKKRVLTGLLQSQKAKFLALSVGMHASIVNSDLIGSLAPLLQLEGGDECTAKLMREMRAGLQQRVDEILPQAKEMMAGAMAAMFEPGGMHARTVENYLDDALEYWLTYGKEDGDPVAM